MGDQKGGPRRLELVALHQRFQTIPVTAFGAADGLQIFYGTFIEFVSAHI